MPTELTTTYLAEIINITAFMLLIERGLPPIVIRSLLDLYLRQRFRTRWKGCVSDEFKTSNGIRQGGVISPVLFCIYIDELLLRLESKGHGCWIGQQFYGALGYADDLTLLAPTISGLSSMIEECEKFGNEYNVKYNPDKTMCMHFSKKSNDNLVVKMNGKRLSWVKNIKYLGNYLDCDMSEKTDVRMKRSDLVYRVNHTTSTLGKCHKSVIVNIFNTKCCHFYGAQSWNFCDPNIKQFETMWNRCVRRILDLPLLTHRILLPGLIGKLSAVEQIYCRFVKLYNGMLKSDNKRIVYIAKMSNTYRHSIIAENLSLISKRLDCDIFTLCQYSVSQIKKCLLSKYSAVEPIVAQICELSQVLQNQNVFIEGFEKHEVEELLYTLCTG